MILDIAFWKDMKYSLYGMLIFLLLTNPVTQVAIQSLVHSHGIPAIEYIFNGLLFFCLMLGLLLFVKT